MLTKPRTQTPRGIAGSLAAARSASMTRKRPAHVLAHERRRMVSARGERFDERRRRRCVAQRHGDVAKPSFVADAPDRRALEAAVELFLAPREQLGQLRIV